VFVIYRHRRSGFNICLSYVIYRHGRGGFNRCGVYVYMCICVYVNGVVYGVVIGVVYSI
jgi:hypothetical protein